MCSVFLTLIFWVPLNEGGKQAEAVSTIALLLNLKIFIPTCSFHYPCSFIYKYKNNFGKAVALAIRFISVFIFRTVKNVYYM